MYQILPLNFTMGKKFRSQSPLLHSGFKTQQHTGNLKLSQWVTMIVLRFYSGILPILLLNFTGGVKYCGNFA